TYSSNDSGRTSTELFVLVSAFIGGAPVAARDGVHTTVPPRRVPLVHTAPVPRSVRSAAPCTTTSHHVPQVRKRQLSAVQQQHSTYHYLHYFAGAADTMRTAILLAVLAALAAVALAAPAPEQQLPAGYIQPSRVRHRRFVLWGWDLGGFLRDVNRQVHNAWAASTHWVHRLLHGAHRLPQHEAVYELALPGGGIGVLKIISFRAQHPHRGPLVWDGKRLAWQHHHQHHGHDGNLLTLDHNGMHHAIRLDALARYLRHVPAGTKVRAEVLGSGWRSLRIVLHVVGKHGKEDASKSVSILVSKLIERHWSHEHSKSSHEHTSRDMATKSRATGKKVMATNRATTRRATSQAAVKTSSISRTTILPQSSKTTTARRTAEIQARAATVTAAVATARTRRRARSPRWCGTARACPGRTPSAWTAKAGR
ncbi:Tubulin alpha-2 chain, partial [Frankliniella fusca]